MGSHHYPPNLSELLDKRKAMNSGLKPKDNPETFRHICAVVSVHNEILSVGYNQVRPGSRTSIHAEENAFVRAREAFRRKEKNRRITVDIYVMRDNGLCSRPCFHCTAGWLQNNPYFKVRYIYYTEDHALRRVKIEDLLENPHISGGHRKDFVKESAP